PKEYALWEFSGVDPAFAALQIVDAGTTNGPSQWRIGQDMLTETSGINSPAQPEWRFGTSAVFGDVTWNDYRVTATVSSGDDDDIGIMFRIAGTGDYYRFAINKQIGYQRLMRFVGNAATVLWEAFGWRYQYDQLYELEVECRGAEIRLRLDGTLLATAVDSTHARGRVALYSYAQTAANFHRVRVEALDGSGVLYSEAFNRTVL